MKAEFVKSWSTEKLDKEFQDRPTQIGSFQWLHCHLNFPNVPSLCFQFRGTTQIIAQSWILPHENIVHPSADNSLKLTPSKLWKRCTPRDTTASTFQKLHKFEFCNAKANNFLIFSWLHKCTLTLNLKRQKKSFLSYLTISQS